MQSATPPTVRHQKLSLVSESQTYVYYTQPPGVFFGLAASQAQILEQLGLSLNSGIYQVREWLIFVKNLLKVFREWGLANNVGDCI